MKFGRIVLQVNTYQLTYRISDVYRVPPFNDKLS